MSWFRKKNKKKYTAEQEEVLRDGLKNIRPFQRKASEELKNDLLSGIFEEINEEDHQTRVVQLHKSSESEDKHPGFIKWAAAVALLIGLGVTLLYISDQIGTTVYYTDAGEKEKIYLPDGSEVVLNASSKLSFRNDWDGEKSRQIWLDGEAFFSVVHTVNDLEFLVHTKEVTIEVLGTEFNVNDRHRQTEVVLRSGKVKLNVNDNEEGRPLKEVTMVPNEMVIVTEGGKEVSQQVVKADNYTSWISDQLIFESTSIKEVAERLHDNLDIEIVFMDKEIMQKKFTGTIPLDKPEVFFLTLQRNYNLQIDKKGKTIVIR